MLTHRNYFGHQDRSSLRTVYLNNLDLPSQRSKKPLESMSHFIRAPAIVDILDSDSVDEVAFIFDDDGNKITVAVEQRSRNLLATAFDHRLRKSPYITAPYGMPSSLRNSFLAAT